MTTDYRTPSRQECLKALEDYGTPENVVEHCKAVAEVAYTLGKSLKEKGMAMDLDLILAAGLLHDIARVHDKHWEVAAEYCLSRGWPREAEIIRTHMMYEFNDFKDFDETDIVCLADRLVLEDHYVGIDERMDYIVAKAKRMGNDDHVPHILRRKETTRKLIAEMEEYIGISLDSLFAHGNEDRQTT